MKPVRIVCIADTHGFLPQIPECDLLIIAGDWNPMGRVWGERNLLSQLHYLDTTFRTWIDSVPASMIVAVPGNHDTVCQKMGDQIPYLRWVLLHPQQSMEVVVAPGVTLKVWGTPWTPWFYNYGFNAPQGDTDETFLTSIFGTVPEDTDIVISHGPPRDVRDETYAGQHVGSKAFRTMLGRVNPMLAVFGHIHDTNNYGTMRLNHTLAVNAGLTRTTPTGYEMGHDPIVLEYHPDLRCVFPAEIATWKNLDTDNETC